MVLHVIEHFTMLQVQYVEELRCFWSHLKALQAHWGRKSAAIIDPAQMTISNPRRLYCSMQKRVKSELSTLSKRFHFYSLHTSQTHGTGPHKSALSAFLLGTHIPTTIKGPRRGGRGVDFLESRLHRHIFSRKFTISILSPIANHSLIHSL